MTSLLSFRLKSALFIVAAWIAVLPATGHAETVHSVTDIRYDSQRRPICEAVRMDPTVWNTQTDACAPYLSGPNGADRVTKTIYDPAGQVLQMRQAVGTPLEQAYVTYAYSLNGKQTSVVDANGNRADLTYDGFDRQTRWTFPSKNRPSNYSGSLGTVTVNPAHSYYFCDPSLVGVQVVGDTCLVIVSFMVAPASGICPAGYTTGGVPSRITCYTTRSVPALVKHTCPPGYYLTGSNCSQTTGLSTAGAINTADYEEYAYDPNGNRTKLRKRDGREIAFTYDSLNRITKKDLCATGTACTGLAATHTRDIFYEYDLRGLQTKARFDGIAGPGITYAYDGFGRLTSETQNTDGVSRIVSSQYDKNSNRTRVTHPDGQYWQLTYDRLNRATGLRQANTTLGTMLFNNRGLPTQMNWSFGAASVHRRDYGYDTADRLASIGFDLNGTAGDVSWAYTRNPANQILTETQSNDIYSWNGHVDLTRNYTTNGLNQYESAGSVTFCHDANGNLTADSDSVYLYDVENRLVEKRVKGASNSNCAALSYAGALQAQLLYDPTGRLYQVSGGTASIQRFAYDGNAMIGEYNSAGTLLRRYVHGSNAEADDPLIVYEGAAVSNATRRYLHADPRGSIVAVTDYQGTGIATNSYDEYGIPDAASGNDIAVKGRFRYTGQAWIPELGMYYYKARIYSPTLGRFLQTDPIGYEDQYNLYAYVGNDPVNVTDPSGACPRCIISGGKILIKSIFKGKRPDKVGRDELVGAADDIRTIASDPISLDAAAAAADLIIGTGFNNSKIKKVKVSRSASPESARHLEESGATGRILTVDRPGRNQRRRDNMSGTQTRPGTDRDESPPAVFRESQNARVRNIPSSDNRSSGAQIGNQIRDVPNGGRCRIEICR